MTGMQKPRQIINKNIKAIRKSAGLKQREFAKVLGVSLCSLKNLENLSIIPKYVTLSALEKVSSFSISELFVKELDGKDLERMAAKTGAEHSPAKPSLFSSQEIDILIKAAHLWDPETIRCLMLDLMWFTPEEEKIIAEAHEIAKKYTL